MTPRGHRVCRSGKHTLQTQHSFQTLDPVPVHPLTWQTQQTGPLATPTPDDPGAITPEIPSTPHRSKLPGTPLERSSNGPDPAIRTAGKYSTPCRPRRPAIASGHTTTDTFLNPLRCIWGRPICSYTSACWGSVCFAEVLMNPPAKMLLVRSHIGFGHACLSVTYTKY